MIPNNYRNTKYPKSSVIENLQKKEYSISHQSNSIILMLDMEGTLNNINDEKAKKFMDIIQMLRIKNNANQAILCLSTHSKDTKEMCSYLNILNKNLKPNIKIGKCFYLQGIYDYDRDIKQYINEHYNHYKTQVFEQHYLQNNNALHKNTTLSNPSDHVSWFAIIDDQADPDYINKFIDSKLMTIFRPSQYDPNCKKSDNCMCYSTTTKGFDGVLEMLTQHQTDIQYKSSLKRLEEQKNYLFPLTYSLLTKMCEKQQYDLILRYLQETKLQPAEYKLLEMHMRIEITKKLSITELQKVKQIVNNIPTSRTILTNPTIAQKK